MTPGLLAGAVEEVVQRVGRLASWFIAVGLLLLVAMAAMGRSSSRCTTSASPFVLHGMCVKEVRIGGALLIYSTTVECVRFEP